MSRSSPTLIYLDTNMYARPFDNQTRPNIKDEADAFLEIIEMVKAKRLTLLSSDILMFEVYNILNEQKRAKIEDYLNLSTEHIDSSDEVLKLGKRIENNCRIRPRDALHIASAVLGQARYFLSCDKKITQMKQTRCYRRLVRSYRSLYFSAMDPIRFVEKLRKGEIE